jgi:hypothetical protein
MKQQSRRPGMGDGSNVLLGGRHSEPTENTLEKQRPGHSQARPDAPDKAVLNG